MALNTKVKGTYKHITKGYKGISYTCYEYPGVIGHFETSAPIDQKMTWNIKIYMYIYILPLPLRPKFHSVSLNMILNWTLKGQM